MGTRKNRIEGYRTKASRRRLALVMATRRKLAGLTQQAVAEAIGVTRANVSQVETGEFDPALEYTRRFARLVGCGVDDLLAEAA